MLLHLYQPTEPGMEELGRTKPNGELMYPGKDKQILSLSLFLPLLCRNTGRGKGSLENS